VFSIAGGAFARGRLGSFRAAVIAAGLAERIARWLGRRWGGSGGGGERANAGERLDERAPPRPAGGEVKRPAAGGPGQTTG
jgi:hypothetical protein